MKLPNARLCLDCDEVHESQVCPACGSEVFAFLTRWVQPASDVRVKAQLTTRETTAPEPRTPEQIDAWRQLLEEKPSRRTGLLTKGLLGLAAFGLAGLAWRSASQSHGSSAPAGAPSESAGADPRDRKSGQDEPS